jgi:hypothetical protein
LSCPVLSCPVLSCLSCHVLSHVSPSRFSFFGRSSLPLKISLHGNICPWYDQIILSQYILNMLSQFILSLLFSIFWSVYLEHTSGIF